MTQNITIQLFYWFWKLRADRNGYIRYILWLENCFHNYSFLFIAEFCFQEIPKIYNSSTLWEKVWENKSVIRVQLGLTPPAPSWSLPFWSPGLLGGWPHRGRAPPPPYCCFPALRYRTNMDHRDNRSDKMKLLIYVFMFLHCIGTLFFNKRVY